MSRRTRKRRVRWGGGDEGKNETGKEEQGGAGGEEG